MKKMKLLNYLKKKNITIILLIVLLILLLIVFINNQYKSSFANSKQTKRKISSVSNEKETPIMKKRTKRKKEKIKGRQINEVVKTGFNQCIQLTINNNKYLIYVPEDQKKAIENLCSIKNQNQLVTIDDGVYTYIRFIDSNKKESMFFTKNFSIQELCTKHGNILDRLVISTTIKSTKLRSRTVYPVEILHAGEFQKIKNKYYFNFMSGTYSRPEYESTNKDVIKKNLLNFLSRYIPEKNIKISITQEDLEDELNIKTFITKGKKDNLFTELESIEYLKILIDAGFKFYLFDIDDPEIDKYLRSYYYSNFFNKKIEEATTIDKKNYWKEEKIRKICGDFWRNVSNPELEIVKKTKIVTKKVINEINKKNKSVLNTITKNIKNILPFTRN